MKVSIRIPDWARHVVCDHTDMDSNSHPVDAGKVRSFSSELVSIERMSKRATTCTVFLQRGYWPTVLNTLHATNSAPRARCFLRCLRGAG